MSNQKKQEKKSAVKWEEGVGKRGVVTLSATIVPREQVQQDGLE